ncbi:DUF5677 domain-containing protein [Paenibacillus vini]|uniref:Uncharacterized protein n=1 Tax=Paenibacillus vini TaxID=1476024 RepID=A0ABQ4MA44_9BACL|nr:DUF5677 domain-containing protein [Paenibacillus vini]GIP52863.1 hypothetical protein J42TS3_18980 [Paenibacillus vini]
MYENKYYLSYILKDSKLLAKRSKAYYLKNIYDEYVTMQGIVSCYYNGDEDIQMLYSQEAIDHFCEKILDHYEFFNENEDNKDIIRRLKRNKWYSIYSEKTNNFRELVEYIGGLGNFDYPISNYTVYSYLSGYVHSNNIINNLDEILETNADVTSVSKIETFASLFILLGDASFFVARYLGLEKEVLLGEALRK